MAILILKIMAFQKKGFQKISIGTNVPIITREATFGDGTTFRDWDDIWI
jgi:hypothetical protein